MEKEQIIENGVSIPDTEEYDFGTDNFSITWNSDNYSIISYETDNNNVAPIGWIAEGDLKILEEI